MASDRMTVQELSAAMGKDYYWVRDELRRDAMRDVKHWPFATAKEGDTGQWSYLIIKSQYDKWKTGDLPAESIINYDLLAEKVADKLYAKLKPYEIRDRIG